MTILNRQTELSIIIANYNNQKLTEDCLESIKKESEDISYEVIVIDNGSTDGSVELLKSLVKEKFWSPRLKLILNNTNTGFVTANNQGIKIARGTYLLLLNNDTIVHKNALKELLKFAHRATNAGVIGARLLNADGSVQMSCFRFPTLVRAIRQYWLGEKGLMDKFVPVEAVPTEVDSVVGAALLITPNAYKKVGVLDKRYWAYFEDLDYCRRVWAKGLKVYYLPTSLFTHYHGATFKLLSDPDNQWRKLVPSSKIYHGLLMHYLINFVLWTGQKAQKIFS